MNELKFVARGYSSGILDLISMTAFVKVTHLKVLLNAVGHLLDAGVFFFFSWAD